MHITVELKRRGAGMQKSPAIEIYLDMEGLQYFIEELSTLKDSGDHIHFMTPSWGMNDLSEQKQGLSNVLAHHLKLTLI